MERTCKFCGKTINDGDKFCQGCGASVENEVVQETLNNNVQNNINTNPQYNQTNNNAGKTNPSAVAGFVCSLVGLFFAGIFLGVLAICLGVSAKKHIKIFENEKGKGLATAAVVIGIIDIAGAILITILNAALTAIL